MSQRPSLLPPELKAPERSPLQHFEAPLPPASEAPSIEGAMQTPHTPAPHYVQLMNPGVRKPPR
jgi:hypothetical protein